MDQTTETASLVIREHNFQEAKNSLKQYSETSKEKIELGVDLPKRGIYNFKIFNSNKQMVLVEDLNAIISEIQSRFVALSNFNQGLVGEFSQIYNAFESLDKDYFTAIVHSIQTAEKISQNEQEDRAKIKELVENLEVAVTVLKNFKEDIEQLKHLPDIDALWESLGKQEILLHKLCNYMEEVSVERIMETEKNTSMLRETISNLTRKVKIAYVIAAGASAVAVLNLILNLLGVL